MTETIFAPVNGLAGGALIGLSATLLMLFVGRIAGLSGIFGGLLVKEFGSEFRWRLVFIIGLLIGTAWAALLLPEARQLSFAQSQTTIVIGGLLVGAGVTLGAGCTSGHGICGLSLMSKRSLTATLTFMAAAMITVFLVRHVLGASL